MKWPVLSSGEIGHQNADNLCDLFYSGHGGLQESVANRFDFLNFLLTVFNGGKKLRSCPAWNLVCNLSILSILGSRPLGRVMFSSHTSGIFIAADSSLRPFSFFVWRNGFCLKNHRASLLSRGEIFCFPGSNHNLSVPRTCHRGNSWNAAGEPS